MVKVPRGPGGVWPPSRACRQLAWLPRLASSVPGDGVGRGARLFLSSEGHQFHQATQRPDLITTSQRARLQGRSLGGGVGLQHMNLVCVCRGRVTAQSTHTSHWGCTGFYKLASSFTAT